MRNLKLKCPNCNRGLRTENGLAWHLLHIHQIKLTYADLKKEIDRQMISRVPMPVRVAHTTLLKRLIAVTEACNGYLRQGNEPPPVLKHEEETMTLQLAQLEVQYPALGAKL